MDIGGYPIVRVHREFGAINRRILELVVERQYLLDFFRHAANEARQIGPSNEPQTSHMGVPYDDLVGIDLHDEPLTMYCTILASTVRARHNTILFAPITHGSKKNKQCWRESNPRTTFVGHIALPTG